MSGLSFDLCLVQLQCGSRLSVGRGTFFEEALLVEDGDCVDEKEDGFDESAEHVTINN